MVNFNSFLLYNFFIQSQIEGGPKVFGPPRVFEGGPDPRTPPGLRPLSTIVDDDFVLNRKALFLLNCAHSLYEDGKPGNICCSLYLVIRALALSSEKTYIWF